MQTGQSYGGGVYLTLFMCLVFTLSVPRAQAASVLATNNARLNSMDTSTSVVSSDRVTVCTYKQKMVARLNSMAKHAIRNITLVCEVLSMVSWQFICLWICVAFP